MESLSTPSPRSADQDPAPVARGDPRFAEQVVVAQETERRRLAGDIHERVAADHLDRFERRDGQWRIARRTVVHDWSCTPQVLPPALGFPIAAFVQGRRDRTDRTYVQDR